ncbi:PhoX family phosphatase [Kocuria coralli]|uniref:PhoX family phosphatase n=1 Tax=Kocuria coralli TaxID=1461025 RepID=A0A5J5L2F0_9MICC|nr:PhoX family phosphatase [Kocuria coralli]KAA9395276.1 PhoX family phosphatase [Kocuria coralli]
MNRFFLPMLGHTNGKRSPLTCALKCGSQCTKPVCNTSANGTFREVASSALSRRAALGLGAAAAVTVGVAVTGSRTEARATFGYWGCNGAALDFDPIDPVAATVDDLNVAEGYDWSPIIRWGDPLFDDSPEFDPHDQTAEAQLKQFGFNNDYLDILPDEGGTTGVLVCNHEYTNENTMFPEEQIEDLQRTASVGIAAHGMAVVEIVREAPGKPWTYVRGGWRNRRITADTPFRVDGPAAGSDLLKTAADPEGLTVLGTQNNCSGGVTPWGTILSGEENIQNVLSGPDTPENQRYGIPAEPPSRRWDLVDPRWDGNNEGYANEVNRFGYIVEIDPSDPASTPVKHTSMGRFKHEGANVHIAPDGTVVAYSGDDERFDYLYKFVSAEKYIEGDRAHNMGLLSSGDLYVAKFTGNTETEIDGSGRLPSDGAFDGKGEWLPLVVGGESRIEGMAVDEVLVYTRLAADKAGATKMDRPEDVEPNPHTGKVYVACTNNTQRGEPDKAAADEANPRTNNRDGHVIEITEDDPNSAGTTFQWDILLVCGDPAKDSTAYFSGFPADQVSPISCPDNLAFDSEGNLWISTDGAPGTIGYNDGLFRVDLTGEQRGRTTQFLSVPQDAETCGPVIHDKEQMVYVAVQHPGEDGTFAQPRSYFPDYVLPTRQGEGQFAFARPSVVQVFSLAGGEPPFVEEDEHESGSGDGDGHGHGHGHGGGRGRAGNGKRGPRRHGYRGKSSEELRRKARQAPRSYSDG